jgi:hypothetical protein
MPWPDWSTRMRTRLSPPTVAADSRGPHLTGAEYGAGRLAQYAADGVTVVRDAGGSSPVTLEFARAPVAARPLVTAAGRFLAPARRYFPRMHSPVAPDELAAAVTAEVAAGAAWVKVIGDFPYWGDDGPVPGSGEATYDLRVLREAVAAAHAAGARVAVHSSLADSGLVGIGADSIDHGTAIGPAELSRRLREHLPYAVACGVRVLAGTDVVGTIA